MNGTIPGIDCICSSIQITGIVPLYGSYRITIIVLSKMLLNTCVNLLILLLPAHYYGTFIVSADALYCAHSIDYSNEKLRPVSKLSQQLRTHIFVQELDSKECATRLSGIIEHAYFHTAHTQAIQIHGGQRHGDRSER